MQEMPLALSAFRQFVTLTSPCPYFLISVLNENVFIPENTEHISSTQGWPQLAHRLSSNLKWHNYARQAWGWHLFSHKAHGFGT